MNHQEYLKLAIKIGNQVAKPYNFGAVVVKAGSIIAAEHGHVHSQNNPSLHAEIAAIVTACKNQSSNEVAGAILYSSHEPCVMCFSCASWAHIDKIIYAIDSSKLSQDMYEYVDLDLQELSKKLHRPMGVEHIPLY